MAHLGRRLHHDCRGRLLRGGLTAAKSEGGLAKSIRDPLMEYRCFWDIGTRDATAIWVAQFVGSDPGAELLRGGRTAAWQRI
jgi:hypothetical protein